MILVLLHPLMQMVECQVEVLVNLEHICVHSYPIFVLMDMMVDRHLQAVLLLHISSSASCSVVLLDILYRLVGMV